MLRLPFAAEGWKGFQSSLDWLPWPSSCLSMLPPSFSTPLLPVWLLMGPDNEGTESSALLFQAVREVPESPLTPGKAEARQVGPAKWEGRVWYFQDCLMGLSREDPLDLLSGEGLKVLFGILLEKTCYKCLFL